MEGVERSSHLKRPRRPLVDEDSEQPPVEKRPRFPKGKKAKKGDDAAVAAHDDDGGLSKLMDPKLAAEERTKRRNQIREEELFRGQGDISAEVHYEDNATFEDGGIRIEPFNLKQEREEGYFDANGNFVEYASKNEIKDAWLDSLDVDSSFAEKKHEQIISEEDYQDLSSKDIGKIKRNIANLLQPGETIIQALKRLKSTSSDERGKMSEIAKSMFDQLTEDAMKLMENGEYNVYHEEREIFEREAAGYERLARARDGTVGTEDSGTFDATHKGDIFSNGTGHGASNSSILDIAASTTEENVSSLQVSSSDVGENLDMFGEEDENTHENLQSDGTAMCSSSTSEQILQSTSEILESSHNIGSGEAAGGGFESDYVYDQSTGYYYSSNLGYYYDPSSGLYCCATSGTWYSFDESTGSYSEIQNAASTGGAYNGIQNAASTEGCI